MYYQTQSPPVPPPPPSTSADKGKTPAMYQAPPNLRAAPPTVHRPSELFFTPSAGEVNNSIGLYSRIPVTAPSAASSRSPTARPVSSYQPPVHSSSVSSYFSPSTPTSPASSSTSPGTSVYSQTGIIMPRRSSSPPPQQYTSPAAPTRAHRAMSSSASPPYSPRPVSSAFSSNGSPPPISSNKPSLPSFSSFDRKIKPPSPPAVSSPVTDEHRRELEKVLEMSKEEADALDKLEEEQLRRALEESSKISSVTTPSSTHASSSGTYTTPVERGSSIVEPTMAFPEPQLPTTVYDEPISFGVQPQPVASTSSHVTSRPSTQSQSSNTQISDDEAFARRLMQEEEERASRPPSLDTPPAPSLRSRNSASAVNVKNMHNAQSDPHHRSSLDVPPVPSFHSRSSSPARLHDRKAAPVILPTYTESTPSPVNTTSPPSDSSPTPPAPIPTSSPTSAPAPSALVSPPSPVQEAVEEETPSPSPPIPTGSNAGNQAVNMNHYVDRDLLRGVSIGFKPPSVPLSSGLEPMEGVMPNIISLPYGRCPPLHLQAPSWRHLLKLTAWLSGTRMEPTMEAIEGNKSDQAMKLRVVIQFIRAHPASRDWRTILWFTIDHSPPHNRKPSVDELPYSYTLSSPLPALLQDSADTVISKLYTIPESEGLQFPPLPITFPSLAAYLQASLVESRRHSSSDPSGLGKLAKMVDFCFPESAAAPESNGRMAIGGRVGGFIKKVKYIGRSGHASNGNSRRGAGNEDTYEMVTPFVPDQWQ